MSTECLFCRIVAGEVPATVVADTETVLAFRDINPQAPLHVVVVPKEHYADVGVLAGNDPRLAGEVLDVANLVAAEEGYPEGYRIVFNTGADAGQSVFHVHAHVLAGRPLAWPPG